MTALAAPPTTYGLAFDCGDLLVAPDPSRRAELIRAHYTTCTDCIRSQK